MLEQLCELLGVEKDRVWKRRDGYFEIRRLPDGYYIKYGMMYEAPKLNFGNLVKLSDLLGTMDITVDEYAEGGCETCDYGSDYGHEIYIKNITKNKEEFDKLVEETND